MQRFVMLVGMALLWLILADATCDSRIRQETLMQSYRLASFRLEECRKMGAEELDRGGLELALRLIDETEEILAKESWSAAQKHLALLEETVAGFTERLKHWDPDGDGLSNYAEFMLYGTSWSNGDSDGDGHLDGSEVLIHETDPLDPCAIPMGVTPEIQVQRLCPAL